MICSGFFEMNLRDTQTDLSEIWMDLSEIRMSFG